MNDEKTMSPEEFFKEFKRTSAPRYAFVLGNGINYYLQNKAVSWDALLNDFIQDNGLSLKAPKGISNTEMANLLELEVECRNEKTKNVEKMQNSLMKYLKERLSENEKECALLDTAWENHYILTTNYDDQIKKYVADTTREKIKYCRAEPRNDAERKWSKSAYYPWYRFWGLEDCPANSDPLKHHHSIWHIHGKFNSGHSQSILFTLTRYVHAIKRVEQWKLASDTDWPGRNTWVNLFYNAPLIIAGLSLRQEEVFLRTLLIERKRHWRRRQGPEPQSYYLVFREKSGDTPIDGRDFLRALGFKVVEFYKADDLYNDKNWEIFEK